MIVNFSGKYWEFFIALHRPRHYPALHTGEGLVLSNYQARSWTFHGGRTGRTIQGVVSLERSYLWVLACVCFAIETRGFYAEEGLAHRFFASLLPEGGARDQIIRDPEPAIKY